MAEAESAIKARLEAVTTGLSSSTAIYATLAPPDAVRPYLVFTVVGDRPTEVMGGETKPTDCFFTVEIYADTFLQIVDLTNIVRANLARGSGTYGSVVVQDTFYEGRGDYFDEADRDYQRVLDFTMYYEE